MGASRKAALACLVLASAWGCGRTELAPGDIEVSNAGTGGAGGTPSTAGRGGKAAGGKATGGSAIGGSAAGGVAMGGSAGSPSAGAAGSGGSLPVGCRDQLQVRGVTPKNGAVTFPRSGTAFVQFDCAVDAMLALPPNAKLYSQLTGPLAASYGISEELRQLWITPDRRFGLPEGLLAGERVTGWLGEALGGPYLWQFTARVSAASPARFQAGAQSFASLPRATDVAFGDLDSDGDPDMLVGTKSSLVWLSNLGDGSFTEPQALPVAGLPVVGDVDQDGDLDIAANGQLLLNDGSGAFELGPAISGCVTLGDVDGDGDLDCLANVGYGKDQQPLGHVLFNDGTGVFSAGDDTPFGFECDVADLDGDGDLDAVCVSPVVEGARCFVNDGRGAFTRSEQLLGEVGTRAFALGDLDSDGDIDLVLTQWFGAGKTVPNQILLNDGTGYFEHSASLGSDGGDIELGDLDGDGDLDAVFSHLTPYGPFSAPYNPSQIYLNDQQAHFSLSAQSMGDPAFNWFELGDLDRDGDLDALVYNQVGTADNYSGVWFNEE
jgi:hypothetical protein